MNKASKRSPVIRRFRNLGVSGITLSALLLATAGPASAVSSSVSKSNFYKACDAVLVVSDTTSFGNVEVYGGYGCDAAARFFPAEITLTMILNGVEVKRTTKKTPFLEIPQSLDAGLTYPDYSSTDTFQGKMTVKGPNVNFTLKTGTIRT